MDRVFATYMLASKHYGTLYIGVTGDLVLRMEQHRSGALPGFTAKYHVHRLVWYEWFGDVSLAIQREKTMKHWRRVWKINLIEQSNPHWLDLYPALIGRVDERLTRAINTQK